MTNTYKNIKKILPVTRLEPYNNNKNSFIIIRFFSNGSGNNSEFLPERYDRVNAVREDGLVDIYHLLAPFVANSKSPKDSIKKLAATKRFRQVDNQFLRVKRKRGWVVTNYELLLADPIITLVFITLLNKGAEAFYLFDYYFKKNTVKLDR